MGRYSSAPCGSQVHVTHRAALQEEVAPVSDVLHCLLTIAAEEGKYSIACEVGNGSW